MLELKRTESGYWYIELDGKCFHGGMNESHAKQMMRNYQMVAERAVLASMKEILDFMGGLCKMSTLETNTGEKQ